MVKIVIPRYKLEPLAKKNAGTLLSDMEISSRNLIHLMLRFPYNDTP